MEHISTQNKLTGEPSKLNPKRAAPLQPIALTPAELDRLITQTIQQEETIPEEAGIKEAVGKYKSMIWPRMYATNHPTASLLTEYAAKGCPVNCGPSWSRECIIKAIQHGPHKSARSKEAIATLHEETTEKIRNGFARVVKYGDIKNNLPRNLK
eukprot:5200260-Ditylum_brightwellii.AAC.1